MTHCAVCRSDGSSGGFHKPNEELRATSWLATLIDALGREPSVAVRLNAGKTGAGKSVVGGRRVGWNDAGFHLSERPAFTFDPALHQGLYYVQDASSMFVGHVVGELTRNAAGPLTVLDACAAPGGKTTAVIDALPEGSVVVANEFVAKRAAVLRENLAKWGYPYVVVTQGDTSRFSQMEGVFDIVVADVPCSGEGMMRKDEDAVGQWSDGLVEQCSRLQHEILGNLWGALRPGDTLSTVPALSIRQKMSRRLRGLQTNTGPSRWLYLLMRRGA